MPMSRRLGTIRYPKSFENLIKWFMMTHKPAELSHLKIKWKSKDRSEKKLVRDRRKKCDTVPINADQIGQLFEGDEIYLMNKDLTG